MGAQRVGACESVLFFSVALTYTVGPTGDKQVVRVNQPLRHTWGPLARVCVYLVRSRGSAFALLYPSPPPSLGRT
jgi:hypothetical protein